MKSKKIVKTTTSRSEFNRAYKSNLESACKIHCSYCKYHKSENDSNGWYGGYLNDKPPVGAYWKHDALKHPNWKLVSKNKKQWQENPIKIVEESINFNWVYITFEF